MHEMSITQGIVEICQQSADGRKVTEVTLEVGALSGVIPDAVEFCFAACTAGTVLEGARLVIQEIPGRGECGSCGAQFAIKAYYDPCPSCGGYGVRIVSGEELRVKELEVA